jgi:hypothetical protein
MSDAISGRVATAEDASRVAEVMAAAFQDDPVWGWAFPDPRLRPAQLTVWWRFLTDAVMRYAWVWVTPAVEAAAIWIPPGGAGLFGRLAAFFRLVLGVPKRTFGDE